MHIYIPLIFESIFIDEERKNELECKDFKRLEDILNIVIEENTWPFMTENQNEVASLGLFNMLSDLRYEYMI
jgi:hypothetical protein